MKRSFSTVLAPALTTAWLLVAVILFVAASQYDFVHIFILPLDLPKANLLAHLVPGRYLLDLCLAMLECAAFSAACISLGMALLGDQQRLQAGHLAIGTTAFLLGEIVLSVLFLTLIVLYRLTPTLVAITLVLALALGAPRLVVFIRTRPQYRQPPDLSRDEKTVMVLAAASLFLAVLYSSSILGYDAVVQYFSQPKLLSMTQTAVITYPRDPFLVSSLHSEILYTALIELFGDQAARMLSWVNGLVIVLLGLAIGRDLGVSARARLWFVVLMATSTAFVDLLGDGKVELISTAPLLCGVYWTIRSVRQPSGSSFVLAGTLLGFAVIARPYNIFLVPVFVATYFCIHVYHANRAGGFSIRSFSQSAVWMIPPLIVLGAFHLLQNWLWLGDALAPIAAGRYMQAGVWQWQFDPKLLNVYRLLYPLVATYANSPQSLGNITPFVIGFIPFLLLKSCRTALRERPPLMSVALAGVVTLVLWLVMFFTVVEIRYVLFLWALFFLVIGQIMDVGIRALQLRLRNLIGLLVMVSLLYTASRTVLIALASYSPVDSAGQSQCYNLDFCSFLSPLNQSAAPGERVFVLNAYRDYLRPDLFACASQAKDYDRPEQLAKQGSAGFWTELYREGFDYVTYETNFSTYHVHFGSLPPINEVPGWLHVTEFSSNPDGLEKVYRLQAVQPLLQRASHCQLDPQGIWRVRSGDPGTQE